MGETPHPTPEAADVRQPGLAETTALLIRERFPEEVLEVAEYRSDWSVIVRQGRVREILTFLRDEPSLAFNTLIDLTAVDYLGYPGPAREARFEVIYHLASFRGAEHRGRIRIKAPVQEAGASIASAVPVYRGALWPEREVFDMFGILFEGHPDLRRILMPVNFRHHPLRKDYPLRGMGERDVIAPNDPGFVSPRETIKLRRSTDG